MKVMLVTFLYETRLGGGAAQAVYSLAHDLIKEGHAVTVLTTGPERNVKIEQQDGIKIIRFFPPNLYWVYEKETKPAILKVFWQLLDIWNPFAYRQMRGFLEAEKPDVVHVQKLRGISPAIWSAARAASVPRIIHTCQDYELISPEGWLNGRVGDWAVRRVFGMRLYQDLRARFSRSVHVATAPSHFVLEKHTSMGFFPNATCQIVPNCHNYPIEKSGPKGDASYSESRPLRFLFMGRLVPEKGIWELCQAFSMCSRDLPHIVLDIAGWGSLEAALKKEFASIPNIHFVGPVFAGQKETMLRQCDLFILPSKGPDNFPLAIAEAFAFGKPVLSTRAGGIPEVITDGETGFLVEPGSVDALERVIRSVALSPQVLEKMRANCYDAGERYASTVITNQFIQQYQNVR
jgi:glycosyltransferase involved in cell wall biosynthesis